MELFSVKGVITLDDNEFNRGMDRAEGRGRGFGSNLGGAITAGIVAVTTALAGIATGAIAVGSTYEQTMNSIRATTGMAQEDADALGMAFRDMGLDGIFSASQIANAYQYVARMGESATDATNLMSHSMSLAQATGNDLGRTTYFLSNYLLKMGKDASQAEGSVDIFNHSIQRSGMSLSDMERYIFRMTPAFQQMGASTETNVAIMTQLYSVGVRNASLYSGMGGIMQDFAVGGDFATAAMERFNVSQYDIYGNLKTSEELMFAVAIAMENYADATAVGQFRLENLTQVQQDAWFEFQRNAEIIQSEVIPGFYGAGSAAKAAGEQTLSFNQAMGMIQNSGADMLKTIWGIISAPFAQMLGTAAEKMRNLALRMREGGDLHPLISRLGDIIAQLASTIVRLVSSSIEPLLRVITFLGNAIASTISIMTQFAPVILTAAAAMGAFKATMVITAYFNKFKKALIATKLTIGAMSTGVSYLAAKMNALAVASTLSASKITLFSAAAGIGKNAMKALNAVMKANKLGLIIAGITAVVAALALFGRSLNQESEEMRVAREESQKLADATSSLTQSLYNSRQAHTNRINTLHTEAATVRRLADRVEELSQIENKSSTQKAKLRMYVDQLNSAMGETVAMIDAESGALLTSVDAINQRVNAMMSENRIAAYRQRHTEIIMGQIEATEQREKIERRLQELYDEGLLKEENTVRIRGQVTETTIEYTEAAQLLIDELYGLNNEINELSYSYEHVTGYMRDAIEATHESAYAARYAAGAVDEHGNALQQFSEYQIAQATEALEMLAGEFESVQARATDAFNQLSYDTSKSIEQMVETLEANAEATRNWGDNIATIMAEATERGVEEGVLEKLLDMANRGPGYADMLANDLEGTFNDLAPALGESIEASIDYMATAFSIDRSVAEEMAGLVDRGHVALHTAVSNADFAAIGVGTVEGYARGIEQGMPLAVAQMVEMGMSVEEALRTYNQQNSPSQLYKNLGQGVPESFGAGILARISVAISAISSLGQQLISTLSSTLAGGNFHGMGANIINSLISGMHSREGALMAEARRIANNVTNTINNAFRSVNPLMVFVGIGENITDSMTVGMEKGAKSLYKSAYDISQGLSGIYGNNATISGSQYRQLAMANAGIAPAGDTYNMTIEARQMTPHQAMTAAQDAAKLARWTR